MTGHIWPAGLDTPAAANDDVPWAVRYMMPIAALAVVALVLAFAWLFTL